MALVLRGAGFVAQQTVLNRYGLGALAPAIGPDLKTDLSKKRSRGFQFFQPEKRLKLADFSISKNTTGPIMAFRRRFRPRRRPRRRFRRRFRKGRRSFAKRVRRVILRTAEPRRRVNAQEFNLALAEGDGTTRIIHVQSPLSDLLQGDEDDRFDGNKVWIKGMALRGTFSMDLTTPPATSALVRLTLLWSKDQGDGFNSTFEPFGNTTTAITNPTQVPPNVNPRFFMDTSVPFVGAGMVAPFDTTRHKVIRSFMIPVNPGGDVVDGDLSMPTPFNIYVPIRRNMQIEDALQGPIDTVPTRYKNGTYWWVMQVIASPLGTSSDTVVNMSYEHIIYFRDP